MITKLNILNQLIQIILCQQTFQKKYLEVLNIAKRAHRILKCRGVTRSDFKLFNNKFYLLETNTQPGMTSLSLVPEIAEYKKISFDSLIKKILLDASINR